MGQRVEESVVGCYVEESIGSGLKSHCMSSVGEVGPQLTGIFAALARPYSRVLIFCKEGRNRAPNVALWVSWATLLSPTGTPIKVLT